MSVIRTFTVTVDNPGAGNRYYIDGVLQETVNLAEGYTYKFDVSDSSVSGHPFKFSTTNNGTHSGGSEYTTGVTTSGNAGDNGAYVQIVVAASAPQLYYYCQYHSGMGGQANTVDSDTWGVLKWNENSWGSQDSVEVTLTGQSLTSSVGLLTAFPEQGWGSDTWGAENWGESAIDVVLPSLTATASVNLPSESIQVKPGWGTLDWGENGWGTVESAVFNLTGLSATSSVGSLTVVDQAMGLTGLSAQTTVGSLAVIVDNTLTLTGLSAQTAVGSITPEDVMGLTGLSATSAVGSITPADVIGVTGLSAQTTLGSVTITSNPVTALTGVSATSSVGGISIGNETEISLTGLSSTSAIGSLTTTQLSIASLVGLGQTATTTLNDTGIILQYYGRLSPKTSTGYSRKTPKDSTGYTRKTA
jgi:hypothetical protein